MFEFPVGQAFLSNPLVRKLTFTGSTHVGKLLAKGAAEQMKRLIENGLDKGCFYAPTILNKVTPDMLIYREETFGSVAPASVTNYRFTGLCKPTSVTYTS